MLQLHHCVQPGNRYDKKLILLCLIQFCHAYYIIQITGKPKIQFRFHFEHSTSNKTQISCLKTLRYGWCWLLSDYEYIVEINYINLSVYKTLVTQMLVQVKLVSESSKLTFLKCVVCFT